MIARPFVMGCLRTKRCRAFSLLEMLVTVGIMLVLLTIVAPAVNSLFTANQITVGAQTVADRLTLARQTALARNRVVETRFYKFTSPDYVDRNQEIRAVQNFIFDETNTYALPVEEAHFLPEVVIISSAATYSSIVQSGREKVNWTTGDSRVTLPRRIDQNYTAYVVRFRPDGSTDLGAGSWFATVRSANGPSTLPANYATVHIDPHNGSLRLYRPGL